MTRTAAGTGIDLGHHTVKLVRLEQENGSRPRVTHWGTEEVRPDGTESGWGRAQALKRLLRRLKLRARRLGPVATAVGGRDIYLRQVEFPALSAEEIRRALPFEAKKHFPLESLADPILDFQILGEPHPPAPNGNGGMAPAPNGASKPAGAPPDGAPVQDVLLVAAPRERRDEVLQVLDDAGIDPVLVDAEPLPALNALAEHGDRPAEGVMMMMDLGAATSVLAAVEPDGGLYARYLNFSGERLTRTIQEKLGFDAAAAESMKRDLAGPEAEQVVSILAPRVRELVAEVQETVRFLGVRRRDQRLVKLCLCGGASLTAGLRDALASALGVEAGHPDLFQGLDVAGDAPDPARSVCLAGALGLARRAGHA